MPKSILITGCLGFIGYHSAIHYLNQGLKVIGIDNLTLDINKDFKQQRLDALLEKDGFTFLKKDISNKDIWLGLAESQIDIILHLAARAGVRDSESEAASYIETNITGSQEVFSFAAFRRIPVVYASSSSVYGDQSTEKPLTEDNVGLPKSIYATTKIATENLAAYYSNKYQLNIIGLRFFTVYGPLPRKDMAMWKFITAIENGDPITIFDNGTLVRDFTYIDDIVLGINAATIRLLDKIKTNHSIYNLGFGNGRSVAEMVTIIERCLGKKAIIDYQDKVHEDVIATKANLELVNKDLGWKALSSLEVGVEKTIAWYKKYRG
jgi:UDP-glucuronate 4-epimerase